MVGSPAGSDSGGAAAGWATVGSDLVRSVAGGMLFGIPLLFTLEVWDIGSSTTPATMAVVLIVTFVPVTLLVHIAGFRRSKEISLPEVLREATVAVAVGVVAVTGVLILTREIKLDAPLADALGKIVYEATPFAIGAAVACHLISQSPDQTDDDNARATDRGTVRGTVADLGSTLVGALFVAFNIAPTEEIPRLAAASSPPALLAVVAASLVISYGIVYQAGFGDQAKRREQRGIFQHPITETVVAYLVALLASAAMLLFFRNLQPGDPWPMVLDHVVLLGLPAAIGGAAGRLAI
ncbi:MAG: TIGR02587 family membrane protein [Acidimicrobiia bacterium]|nr:TIGR02587 family membrane protein [Acidimicrobiia bacterium]